MSIQAQIEDLRTQRAAEWLEILHGENPDRNAEFLQWITESPLNLDAFLKLEALSRETQALLRSPHFDARALRKDVDPNVLSFRSRSERAGERKARHRRWFSRGSIAPTLAIVVATSFWTYRHFFHWQEYSTGSAQQTIELADGSWVYLNAQSVLAVHLGSSERVMRLTQGEALFDVMKDKNRPFRVRTRDAVVEALGTQFNVNTHPDGTRVAVVKGAVRIMRDEAPTTPSASESATALEAGQAARITTRGRIERDPSVDVRQAVSWSQPQLIFHGTPLEDAVAQFNRQRRAKTLRLEGVPAGSHHYSGMFNATDSETFAAMLARERDLEVLVGEKEIVIRPR